MKFTPEGVGVKGMGFKGLALGAFVRRGRLVGLGVDGGGRRMDGSSISRAVREPWGLRVEVGFAALVPLGDASGRASGGVSVEVTRSEVPFARLGVEFSDITPNSPDILRFRDIRAFFPETPVAAAPVSPFLFGVSFDALFTLTVSYSASATVSAFSFPALRAERRSDITILLLGIRV